MHEHRTIHRVLVVPIILCVVSACTPHHAGDRRVRAEEAAISRAVAADPAWPRETVEYRCEGGGIIQVAYLNTGDGQSFAALYHDGRLSLMRRWTAASGVRYVSMDEQVGLRWHVKGDEGMLKFLAPDHMAGEITLESGCRAARGHAPVPE